MDTPIFNIKWQNELFCTAKNSWTRMRPEARPIKFYSCSYGKKRVDKSVLFERVQQYGYKCDIAFIQHLSTKVNIG